MLFGYARVSTDEQDTRMQLDALRKAGCDAKNIFEEVASGAKAERKELQRMLERLRSGDVVVVWKLDRLARSLKQLITTAEKLEELGVELRSITENIDTTSPSGKFHFHLFGALGEFERELLRQRVKEGMQAARRLGRIGGKKKSLGERELKKARTLLESGKYSTSEVATELNVSRVTLWRSLKEESAT